jgi:hypothetical protein
MKTLYWAFLGLSVIALAAGFALGNPGLGGLVAVVFALGASAVDPSGRGLSRFLKKSGGDGADDTTSSSRWHNVDDA